MFNFVNILYCVGGVTIIILLNISISCVFTLCSYHTNTNQHRVLVNQLKVLFYVYLLSIRVAILFFMLCRLGNKSYQPVAA